MKKLALALVASSMVAGAANANIGTGFTLGVTAGYGGSTGKISGTVAAPAANTATAAGSVDIGGNAPNIGIIGGYGYVSGCLYFGGEVGYTFENTKINNTLSATTFASGSSQLKRNGYFRAALRGGYLFTPNTMLFIALGGNWGKWTLNDSTGTFGFSTANPGSGSKNQLNFAPGIGLETAVHKNVYLRVEYTYEFGPSLSAKNSASTTVNKATNVSSIRSQSGKIGLSYKF